MMLKVYLTLFISMMSGALKAQSAVVDDQLDHIEFYLHTVDLGSHIHEKYGHTQLRVLNRKTGRDVSYTWGLFDFHDPDFALNFYRGIMRYQVGVFRNSTAHVIYKMEGRTVWEDLLRFTPEQKQRALRLLDEQMLPGNQFYAYQYFFDNCSTRPRDLIDRILRGKVRETYAGRKSSRSFRQIVRNWQATTFMTSLGLEVTMNSRLDRLMTQWEEMFLPKSLRLYLGALSSDLEQGQKAGSEPLPLLKPVATYYEAPTPRASYLRDDLFVWGVLGIPLLFVIWTLGAFGTTSSKTQQVRGQGQRVFGVTLFIVAISSGLMGLLMAVSWGYSHHLDLHHNANLLIFWPIDFVFVPLSVALMRRNIDISAIRERYEIAWLAAGLHIGAIFFLALALPLDLIDQNYLRVLMTFGTVLTMLYGIILLSQKGEQTVGNVASS
jgi:hypothetical protein